jgi:hypothetical protein
MNGHRCLAPTEETSAVFGHGNPCPLNLTGASFTMKMSYQLENLRKT